VTAWAEPENARRYQEFAREHPMYRSSSADLVALAWHFDVGATMAAVRRVLEPGGRFVFNVISHYLDEAGPAAAPAGPRPSLPPP
jgi:hypothetical protein